MEPKPIFFFSLVVVGLGGEHGMWMWMWDVERKDRGGDDGVGGVLMLVAVVREKGYKEGRGDVMLEGGCR